MMASTNKKRIKPLVSILPIDPKDVERFWPLAEFMVTEALAFSGKWAESSFIYDELNKDTMQLWIIQESMQIQNTYLNILKKI